MNLLFETDEIRVLWDKGLAGNGSLRAYHPKGDVITFEIQRKVGDTWLPVNGPPWETALVELTRAVRDGRLTIKETPA